MDEQTYYVAYSDEGGYIQGLGHSEDEALEDAQEYGDTFDLKTVRCSKRLYDYVTERNAIEPMFWRFTQDGIMYLPEEDEEE
jgi:hypothetical protein